MLLLVFVSCTYIVSLIGVAIGICAIYILSLDELSFTRSLRYRNRIGKKGYISWRWHSTVVMMIYDKGSSYFLLKTNWHWCVFQFYRLLKKAEAAFGPDNPNTAVHVNSLGLVYRDMEKYSEAIELFKRATTIWAKYHGSAHKQTATGYVSFRSYY
jgi:hypothetical protein